MIKEIGKSNVKLKKIKKFAYSSPNNIYDMELDAIYFLHTNNKKKQEKKLIESDGNHSHLLVRNILQVK